MHSRVINRSELRGAEQSRLLDERLQLCRQTRTIAAWQARDQQPHCAGRFQMPRGETLRKAHGRQPPSENVRPDE